MFAFLSIIQQNEATGIPVTIYSILYLSDRVIVLGQTPQNLRDNPGGAAEWNQSSPVIFDQESENLKKKKRKKNDQTGTQARECRFCLTI